MQHPSVFFKYASPRTACLVLESSRLRWSSPLLFNDLAEFKRMPRFEPSLAEAHRLLPEIIANEVLVSPVLDEARLGPPMTVLLQLVKHLAASGFTRQDCLKYWQRKPLKQMPSLKIEFGNTSKPWT